MTQKLTEAQIIEEIAKIEKEYGGSNKVPGAKTLYEASGWFSDVQTDLMLEGYKALLQNPTVAHVHLPLAHQYLGQAFSETGDFEPDFEWATMTFKADVKAIDNSDILVGLFPAEDIDSGESMEVGYAVASNKPVVNVYTGDWNANPINLMISFGADAYVRDPKDLATFDFLDIAPNKYTGKLI